MDKQNLMTILVQTGFNIERMFQDRAIKKEAYTVLKYRNDLAIAEFKECEGKEPANEASSFSKHAVSGSVNDVLDTIHDKLIDKGFDCFNANGTVKEVDEYKLTFKMVADELQKHYR